MRNSFSPIYITVIIFFFISPLSVFCQEVISLEDALRQGLENNYGIRIEKNVAEIADNNATLGNAGFLPTLSADGSYMRRVEDVNQRFLSGDIQERRGAQTRQLGGGVELRWTVFDGFRMFAAYDRLKALDEAAQHNYRNQVETSAANIITTYYDIVRQQQLLNVLRESIKISAVRLELAKTRYEIGSSSKIEFLQAKVDLNADSSALLRQIADIRKSKMDLLNLIGNKETKPAQSAFVVADTITLLPVLNNEELQNLAIQQNSQLLAAEQGQKAVSATITEARSILFPQLDLIGRYNFNDMQAQAGFIIANQTQGFNYGATAIWTLFPGQYPGRQIQNAKILLDNARLGYEELRLNVVTEITKAYEDYSINSTIVALENENMEFATQNLDIANERYRLGRLNLVEYREAQVSYIAARTRLLTSVYNAKVSETNLLRLSGQLSRGVN